MTPERLMEIRTLVTSHNGTPKMSRELLAYVDELKARLAGYEVAESTAKQWQAEIQIWAARAEAAEALLDEAREAVTALRGNMLVSHGTATTSRGVWFRGGDAVAQCDALDAFHAKLEKRGTK